MSGSKLAENFVSYSKLFLTNNDSMNDKSNFIENFVNFFKNISTAILVYEADLTNTIKVNYILVISQAE